MQVIHLSWILTNQQSFSDTFFSDPIFGPENLLDQRLSLTKKIVWTWFFLDQIKLLYTTNVEKNFKRISGTKFFYVSFFINFFFGLNRKLTTKSNAVLWVWHNGYWLSFCFYKITENWRQAVGEMYFYFDKICIYIVLISDWYFACSELLFGQNWWGAVFFNKYSFSQVREGVFTQILAQIITFWLREGFKQTRKW